ncbi:class I SAM-dependent methyltransferase [Rhizorhabdus dicambivorans]|nr:class I SAM-dependent methyltransferase [Rhizorhabdus dicambivorans]
MHESPLSGPSEPVSLCELTAAAYDAYSAAFLNQVDGEPCSLRLAGRGSGEVDRQIWARIDGELVAMRSAGITSVRILDAGSGPGLWLIQTVQRARQLGFTMIEGEGFDISPEMIVQAHRLAIDLIDDHIALRFHVADIASARRSLLNGSFDVTLCLYNVLNHLPADLHEGVARELSRITKRAVIATVRTIKGPPTIYVQPIDRARAFQQDNLAGRMDVVMADGRHLSMASHLFSSDELRRLFAPYVSIAELSGLDIFRQRFAPHPNWGAATTSSGKPDTTLDVLERRYASDPAFVDQAVHLLLVGLPHARIPAR